jgi:thiamine biosynthesis protein ThiI
MYGFVSLLSSGFDSPTAAYLLIRKGFMPIFVSFLTSDEDGSMRNKILNILRRLMQMTRTQSKVYFIKHDPNLNCFKHNCERKLTCILCKRLMLRIAIKIGELENLKIIVTGDILGEQASQTLDNLIAYDDLFKDFVIIRPLIGWDKQEVINLIRKLDLYELVSEKSATCLFNPEFPETHAKIDEIKREETKINLADLISTSIKNAEILPLNP